MLNQPVKKSCAADLFVRSDLIFDPSFKVKRGSAIFNLIPVNDTAFS